MENPISGYFSLSDNQKRQFAAMAPLYEAVNAKLNLISRRDIANLYDHHVLPSLAIAKVIKFKPGSRILDLGTGGGFPGLPLAVMAPDCQFVLVDSVAKKIKAVASIIDSLGITNATAVCCRAEDLKENFDFVVARGIGRLDIVWRYAKPLINENSKNELPNGLFYLKGGDIDDELPDGISLRRWPLSQYYEDAFFQSKALLLLTSR